MKVTNEQLKQIIKEELQAALKEQAEGRERWEWFYLPEIKQWAAKLKYALDNNTAIKLAKYADKKEIASFKVGDLVKAWIKQRPQKKAPPSGEGEWARGTGAKEKCMRMCKGETNMHSCMQRNCPEFVA